MEPRAWHPVHTPAMFTEQMGYRGRRPRQLLALCQRYGNRCVQASGDLESLPHPPVSRIYSPTAPPGSATLRAATALLSGGRTEHPASWGAQSPSSEPLQPPLKSTETLPPSHSPTSCQSHSLLSWGRILLSACLLGGLLRTRSIRMQAGRPAANISWSAPR